MTLTIDDNLVAFLSIVVLVGLVFCRIFKTN